MLYFMNIASLFWIFLGISATPQHGLLFRPIQNFQNIRGAPVQALVLKKSNPVQNVPTYGSRPYKFAYGVSDPLRGTSYNRKELNDGAGTKGQYQVHLPDGRLQTVTYFADKDGYRAQVSYSKSDQLIPKPRPSIPLVTGSHNPQPIPQQRPQFHGQHVPGLPNKNIHPVHSIVHARNRKTQSKPHFKPSPREPSRYESSQGYLKPSRPKYSKSLHPRPISGRSALHESPRSRFPNTTFKRGITPQAERAIKKPLYRKDIPPNRRLN